MKRVYTHKKHKKHKDATKQKHKKHKKNKKYKEHKTQISEEATFFALDVFKRIKMLPFLFLFAYMRFVLFVRVKSFRKKKKNKEV